MLDPLKLGVEVPKLLNKATFAKTAKELLDNISKAKKIAPYPRAYCSLIRPDENSDLSFLVAESGR